LLHPRLAPSIGLSERPLGDARLVGTGDGLVMDDMFASNKEPK